MDNQKQPIEQSGSLEATEIPVSSVDATPVAPVEAPAPSASDTGVVNPDAPKNADTGPRESLLRRLLNKVNIYFILLLIALAILAGVSYFAISRNHIAVQETTLNTQKLTQDAIDKLAATDSTVGDPKQTLSIESNAIFSGAVLVRGNIDVAGTIKVGGPLSLPGLTVGGTTTLDQAALKSLTVAGDTAIQGKLSALGGLNVTGAASFSGAISAPQITIDTLQLSKDLQLSRHIVAVGGTPTRTNGPALGGGGTATVSGSDTAGTISIGTGSGAPAGCFVTITFAVAFAAAPRVVISPSSAPAGTIDYYTTRTPTGFSVCSATDPADNTAGIVFDYIVIG